MVPIVVGMDPLPERRQYGSKWLKITWGAFGLDCDPAHFNGSGEVDLARKKSMIGQLQKKI